MTQDIRLRWTEGANADQHVTEYRIMEGATVLETIPKVSGTPVTQTILPGVTDGVHTWALRTVGPGGEETLSWLPFTSITPPPDPAVPIEPPEPV